MRTFVFWGATAVVAVVACHAHAITAGSMAVRSGGAGAGISAWRLDESGYLGTYLTLASPGAVTVTVNAAGQSTGAHEHLNIVIGDERAGWDVATSAANYAHTFNLPAGTHFLRTEYSNGPSTSALVLSTVDVVGATLANSHTSANALAAADSYIANYRQGAATLHVPTSLAGASVHVKLRTHAFDFGAAVPNSTNGTLLAPNPTAGSDAARFQQALVDNRISLVTPENAGKWDANEGTRDVLTANVPNPNGGPNIPFMDRISDFAAANGMRYRAHNVIWGPNQNTSNNQQPAWAYAMMQDPAGIDAATGATNAAALRQEITERIGYYVRDRATRFEGVDVFNESYHTGSNNGTALHSYWDLYEVAGIAAIYKEANDAIAAAGSDAKSYVNEYNVLQNQGGDAFANWYARHVEAIQSSGQAQFGENVVGGIGVQYYNNGVLGNHSPARIYTALQNLAVEGLPLTLTEFGVTAGTEANAATVLTETARLAFGTPAMTGITQWNLRATPGAFAPVGALYNNDWSPRQTGVAWQALMNQWDTDVATTVNPDGTINFTGFYGDYDVTIDGDTYPLSIVKGTTDYTLPIVDPLSADFDLSGTVTAADLAIWKGHFALGPGASHADGDATADGRVDGADFLAWQRQFGSSPSLAAVPEPGAGLLAALAVGISSCLLRRM